MNLLAAKKDHAGCYSDKQKVLVLSKFIKLIIHVKLVLFSVIQLLFLAQSRREIRVALF